MVDTNREPGQNEEPIKIKKQPAKKTELKKKNEIKPADKKVPAKKDSPKSPSQAGKFSLAGVKKFLRGAWVELKKVHWPSRQELITFTGVVLVAVAFVAILLFLIDSTLGKILDLIIPK